MHVPPRAPVRASIRVGLKMRVDELQDEIGSVKACPDSLWHVVSRVGSCSELVCSAFRAQGGEANHAGERLVSGSGRFAPVSPKGRLFGAVLAKGLGQGERDRFY